MSLFDLFRPRWRHSDPEVRAEAVRQLGDDDRDLLLRIVSKDADARVRKIALKKIDDPAVLAGLAESDPDEALRKTAGERAGELLVAAATGGDAAKATAALALLKAPRAIAEVARRAAVEEVRKQALAKLDDASALADVARNAEDPEIRRAATARITDVASLREIAIHDTAKEVGLAALAKISDEGALELILKRAKSKAVKAAARDRLMPSQPETPTAPARPAAKTREVSPEAKRRARLAQLSHLAEEAAKVADLDQATTALGDVKAGLDELGVQPGDEEARKRFDKAARRLAERREEHDRIHNAHLAAAQEEQRREAEAAERARKEKEEREAREAARTDEEKAAAAAQEAAREVARLEREKREAEKAVERAKRDAEKAAAKERRDAEQKQNLARLGEICASLEARAASPAAEGDHKLTESTLKTAEAAFQSVGPLPHEEGEALRERYQAARNKLVIRLQELRESENWRRWANVPRLEALCGKVEALAKDEAIEAKEKARQLKALQAEWKTVGPAPREKSEALWQRFKAAGDLVYG